MTFLNPLFFLGLGTIAVPILVHLIQRERKNVVHFPSLMFVRKIPYQSVRRRRIRHWFLLLMRAAAIALIVAAFARPFLLSGAAAAAAAGGGSREVVILLDRSASMGFGDHWERARGAARDAVGRGATTQGLEGRTRMVWRCLRRSLRGHARVGRARVPQAHHRLGTGALLRDHLVPTAR